LVQAGDYDEAISHSLTLLSDLGTTMTSVRVLRELRPVRDAAGAADDAEFCDRFDTAARALSTV
jgi:hypothetical protein